LTTARESAIQDTLLETTEVIGLDMMRFRWILWVWVAFLLVPCFAPGASADDGGRENAGQRYKWFLTVYAGAHAQDDIGDVFLLKPKFEDNAYVVVTALAHEFWHYQDYLSFEAEGQIGKHFNKDTQWEFVGLIIGRWQKFPWDDYVDTSVAVGDGVSYYTDVSEVEKEDDRDAGRTLNYLMFELALGLPEYRRWDLVLRIHHRSSVYGLAGAGGSNFVCGGIKYSF
jgi:hypothetical protein